MWLTVAVKPSGGKNMRHDFHTTWKNKSTTPKDQRIAKISNKDDIRPTKSLHWSKYVLVLSTGDSNTSKHWTRIKKFRNIQSLRPLCKICVSCRCVFSFVFFMDLLCLFFQAGVSPLLQHQLEALAQQKCINDKSSGNIKKNVVVIGQDCVEPLQALRRAGPEVICWFVIINSYSSRMIRVHCTMTEVIELEFNLMWLSCACFLFWQGKCFI